MGSASRTNNTEILATIASVFFTLVMLFFYFGNIVKFTRCDFEPNYQCEIVHAVGIFGPPALVTYWFATDE